MYGSRTSATGRVLPSGRDGVLGTGQQLVRRPLDVHPDDVAAVLGLHPVERGHQLVGGVERNLGDARIALAGGDRVHAALGGQHDERALGGVAHEPAVLGDGVGAQRHRQQVALERHLAGAALAGDVALGRVAVAGDGEAVADDRHLDGGHLVQRQGAGLVGVDRGRRAQRLDGLETLHDGAGLGQRRRPVGEDRRHDGGEAGRDRRHRERDGRQEQRLERLVAVQARGRSRSRARRPRSRGSGWSAC